MSFKFSVSWIKINYYFICYIVFWKRKIYLTVFNSLAILDMNKNPLKFSLHTNRRVQMMVMSCYSTILTFLYAYRKNILLLVYHSVLVVVLKFCVQARICIGNINGICIYQNNFRTVLKYWPNHRVLPHADWAAAFSAIWVCPWLLFRQV